MSNIKLTFSCGNQGRSRSLLKNKESFSHVLFPQTAVFGRIYIRIDSDENKCMHDDIKCSDDNRQVTLTGENK